MSFFDYAEKVEPVQEFGIRDDGKKSSELPVYLDYENKKDWNATVVSENRSDFNFIPVDNRIPYYDKQGNERKRCDAMVYTDQTVVFIELKDQMHNWFDDAVEQLKSTIEHFDNVDGLDKFRFKKAYACNKEHPNFNYHYKERMQQFYRDTGVTLRPEAVIKGIR